MITFSLTILGCSSATPSIERGQTAQLLNIHEQFFLIDCGEGTQLQLKRFGIKIQHINHIFISHLHGDHYFGLIGLISTLHLHGRKNELHIYANAELENIINIQLKVSNTTLLYPLIFHPLQYDMPEIIFENEELTVQTILLKHTVPTCGFLFREKERERNINKEIIQKIKIPFSEFEKIKKGADYIASDGTVYENQILTHTPPAPRSFAYCTDTAYYEPIIEQIKNVDLLYFETTFMQDRAIDAKDKMHATTVEAATIALKAQVKKLLIGHYSARYKDLSPLLEECKQVFENTFLTEDGQKFEV